MLHTNMSQKCNINQCNTYHGKAVFRFRPFAFNYFFKTGVDWGHFLILRPYVGVGERIAWAMLCRDVKLKPVYICIYKKDSSERLRIKNPEMQKSQFLLTEMKTQVQATVATTSSYKIKQSIYNQFQGQSRSNDVKGSSQRSSRANWLSRIYMQKS